jgi:hypothetical protein
VAYLSSVSWLSRMPWARDVQRRTSTTQTQGIRAEWKPGIGGLQHRVRITGEAERSLVAWERLNGSLYSCRGC